MFWNGFIHHIRVSLPFLICCYGICCCAQEDCVPSCGYLAVCRNGTCTCDLGGYKLHNNSYDCQRVLCMEPDCLECSDKNTCTRCVFFLSEQTGHCLQTCNGEAKYISTGKGLVSICKEYTKDETNSNKMDLIIGVAVGVSVGLVMCIIIAICCYCHLRKTRKKINLQQQKYLTHQGSLTAIPYENKGFEADKETTLHRKQAVDEDAYSVLLENLRPQADVLLTLLNQIRRKMKAMRNSDPRIPTYKGVVHQMCRVLVLLHKSDASSSIPADAPGLLHWAKQMLEDYHLQPQDETEIEEESSTNKISYIDVPSEQQQQPKQLSLHLQKEPKQKDGGGRLPSPQYATPNVPKGVNHTQQNSFLSHNSDGGYYSSTPVPVDYHSNTLPIPHSVSHGNMASAKPPKRHGKTHRKGMPQRSKSATNIHSPQNHSNRSSMGYFSNKRFYDPDPQFEIYAPASSYSERSNTLMSTFRGTSLRSTKQPVLSSGSPNYSDAEAVRQPSDNDDSGDNQSNGDEKEPLPFDTTDPVEV